MTYHPTFPPSPRLFLLPPQRAGLGISNWGLSVTTMEEVFLKVARDQAVPETDRRGSQQLQLQSNAVVSGMMLRCEAIIATK